MPKPGWSAAAGSLVLLALVGLAVVRDGGPNALLEEQAGGGVVEHQQQLVGMEQASPAGRKLLQCGECGCGVACPSAGGASQINMVGFGGGMGQGGGGGKSDSMSTETRGAITGLKKSLRSEMSVIKSLKSKLNNVRLTPGPRGPRGFTGHSGKNGRPGTPGHNGARGRRGRTGPIGPMGPMGQPGRRGRTGRKGLRGHTGRVGPRGSRGLRGRRGRTGRTGKRGPRGYRGSTGKHGRRGPRGPRGFRGLRGHTKGVRGPRGPRGHRGKTGSRGPRGYKGKAGRNGRNGRTVHRHHHHHRRHHRRWWNSRGWLVSVYQGKGNMRRVPSLRGLRRLGSARMGYINLRNWNAFHHKIRRTPRNNFVWKTKGTVRIYHAGKYKFCTRSDDGSKLWVRGRYVVNNDGLHGPRTRCGHVTLPRGKHSVKSIGFQRGGGAFMSIHWKGPDTHRHTRLLRSAGPGRVRRRHSFKRAWRNYMPKHRGWTMRVWRGPHNMARVPGNYESFKQVGTQVVRTINFRNNHHFMHAMKGVPHDHFVWEFAGMLRVHRRGAYTICTTSDDGSYINVDHRRLVTNDGLHGARQRCGRRYLHRGLHTVKTVGFQRGGGAYQVVTYRGPDTHNHKRLLRSENSRVETKGWNMKVWKGPHNMAHVPGNYRHYHLIGSRTVPHAIVLKNNRAFSSAMKGVPHDHFVWQFTGQARIRRTGHYTFCTNSDDGSRLDVDRRRVVNNDGLHGPRNRCGRRFLRAGLHEVKVVGFQRGGGAYQTIYWQGPDTGHRRVPLHSEVNHANGWRMRVWTGNHNMRHMPMNYKTSSRYKMLGTDYIPYVNLHNNGAFRRALSNTPHSHFVWEFLGRLVIKRGGYYHLCTKSDDGSKLYLDGRYIVNDDGLHGPRERCSKQRLYRGTHEIKGIGFQHGGGAFQTLTYSGPDTRGRRRYMPSDWNYGRPHKHKRKVHRRRGYRNYMPKHRGWTMRVWRGPHNMARVPGNYESFKQVGTQVVRTINFRNNHHFMHAMKGVPHDHFVWEFAGMLRVHRRGAYTICTTSDDGSYINVDHRRLVTNDGLHGARQRCGRRYLHRGLHTVKTVGFQRGGGAYQVVTYRGPDTHNHRRLLRSENSRVETKGWNMKVWKGPHNMAHVPGNYRHYHLIGSRTVPHAIVLKNNRAFSSAMKGVPHDHFVWQFTGQVKVRRTGHYTFCTNSDDGSRLDVDRRRVVNNDGLHGPRNRCGRRFLRAGYHEVKVVGFQRGGGAYQTIYWQGPDTGHRRVPLRSTVAHAKGWRMRVWTGNHNMRHMPMNYKTSSRYKMLGTDYIPYVNLHNNGAFRRALSNTPHSHFVWEFLGKLKVKRGGYYHLCTKSDDGSKLYLDGRYIVNDDGLHGPRERCSKQRLHRGYHEIKGIGFQHGGGAFQTLTYSGPDTHGHRRYIPSSL